MEDTIDIIQVLPNKSPHPRIIRMGLIPATLKLILRLWPFDGNIVGIRNGMVWYFVLKDVRYVAMHNLEGVCPSHGYDR